MFKFETIKKSLSEQIDINKQWWIVISWFDKNDKLLFVKWIIFSDDKIRLNLKKLFDNYVSLNKKLKNLLIDVIIDIKEIKDAKELKKLDLKTTWIFIWDTKNNNWTFLLPKTKWIKDFQSAYKLIRQKIKFTSTSVNVYTFSTKRIVLEK